jgi:hypothetical protein
LGAFSFANKQFTVYKMAMSQVYLSVPISILHRVIYPMKDHSNKRAQLLEKYLTAQEKLQKLEEENDLLKETNYRLARELEEKENAVGNLFSYIEGLKRSS